MKKREILIFFCALILLFLESTNAISSDLKTEYERGESIIIEISGNILEPIDKKDVEFLRGHVAIPIEYDLRKLENKYFLWAIAPQNANNYTLVINNIATTSAGRTEIVDFRQNFSVTENLSDYSIKPGFISAQEDFIVSVQLNEDSEKTINLNFPDEREIVLKPGRNDIGFSIASVNASELIEINIGKYVFHALIISKSKSIFEINPKYIESVLLLGDNATYPFQIINLEEEDVNVNIEYDKTIFSISAENINLKAKGAVELNMSLIGNIAEEMKKNGINQSIFIRSDGFFIELPVVIKFTEKQGEAETPYLEEYEKLEYCPKLNGIVCTAGESCDGESRASLDGACCIGKCTKEETGGYSPWIGYTIAGVLFILILVIFWKYRKTKGESSFSKRVEEAEEKMKP